MEDERRLVCYICTAFTALSKQALSTHIHYCAKRQAAAEVFGRKTRAMASSSSSSSSSSSGSGPSSTIAPASKRLCVEAAPVPYDAIPPPDADNESCASNEAVWGATDPSLDVQPSSPLRPVSPAPFAQPHVVPLCHWGGADGNSAYIPLYTKADRTFLELQSLERTRILRSEGAGPHADSGVLDGPIPRLMKLDRTILRTAIIRNNLKLSDTDTDAVKNYAVKLAEEQCGVRLEIPCPETVKRHARKACDRADDGGVIRSAKFRGKCSGPGGWPLLGSSRSGRMWLLL